MRIVGGQWAGRSLISPGTRVRPTAEPVRDHWMTLLGPALRQAKVLDLFSGSGALGLEALSRGAATCDFIENGNESLHALKGNVAAARCRKRARIFKRDAIPFVDRLPACAYDIGFADPPYGSRKLDLIVERWLDTPFARIFTVEHPVDHPLAVGDELYALEETVVTILRAEDQ